MNVELLPGEVERFECSTQAFKIFLERLNVFLRREGKEIVGDFTKDPPVFTERYFFNPLEYGV